MNESTQIFSESCKTNLFGVAKLDKCCDKTLQANHLKKKLNCKIIVVFYVLKLWSFCSLPRVFQRGKGNRESTSVFLVYFKHKLGTPRRTALPA